jgi:ABC-type nitrate/sulfonate/bicarbonate transport system permease component
MEILLVLAGFVLGFTLGCPFGAGMILWGMMDSD